MGFGPCAMTGCTSQPVSYLPHAQRCVGLTDAPTTVGKLEQSPPIGLSIINPITRKPSC